MRGTLLQEEVGEALAQSGARTIGASVVQEGGIPLVDLNGDGTFESNSIQKLFTTGTALLELGSGYRYCTEVRASRRWNGEGVMPGDVVLVASGDPTLTGDDVQTLCDAVAQCGIRRATGFLIIDDTRYDRLRSVPGWNTYYVPAFCAPMSAFMLDRNRPRRDRAYIAEPAIANGAKVIDALARSGVVVEGPPRVARTAAPGQLVAQHQSPSMAEIVQSILLQSDSLSAELVVKELGAHGGDATTIGGLKVMASVATRLGVAPGRSSAIDGSGLSVSNIDSPRRQVAWLRAMERSPLGEQFRRCLPVAGESGTLSRRFRGTRAAGRVAAKTGTRRRSGTVNLAGYAISGAGCRVWFSFVLRGASSQTEALAALDSAVVAMVRP